MTQLKTELHPRNRHRALYDFKELIKSSPILTKFVEIFTDGLRDGKEMAGRLKRSHW